MKLPVKNYLLILTVSTLLHTQLPAQVRSASDVTRTIQKKEAYGLIQRVLPAFASRFEVEMIPQENGKDVFEVESVKGKVQLRGSNGVSVASAFYYYLKNFAHCDISWNGSNIHVPSPLPVVPKKVHKATPFNYRYYLNYCTFNYSASWWNWDRWQWEIDWMAMNGINMPLALTGQNAVWNRVYKSMGFSDSDLKSFFSGPAYFNWFWMGNLDGWGGPLPESWMKSHEELQKKILSRERSLGMTPVLPAFTGHVPPSFKEKYPQSKLTKTNWNGSFDDVYILSPDDPMFTEIGKKFIQEETKIFGTDHLYSADTFNENTPPTNDSTYLSAVSKKVYDAMAAADSKAVWIMQGWLFSYTAKFWQPTQIQALLKAVPDDKMIILDLYSESKPVWNKTDAYYGKPWIWCMLHNFGGNISLYGRMNQVANDPVSALHDPKAGKLTGIGLTPEAIEQNPVMYELLLEHVWNDQPVNLDSWLKDYALRRYGKKNEAAEKAWIILKNTVYDGAVTSGGPESIITGRPTFSASTRWTNTKKAYQPKDLVPAWGLLVQASTSLKNSEGFRYDLVDVTRQVLANYADTLQQEFAHAYQQHDQEKFHKTSQLFLQVMDDMDQLLSTQKDFLLGRWLNAAKACGTTVSEKELYEKNARNLITLWGDKNSPLHEYACKQWSGLIRSFYKPRWQQFFDYVNTRTDEKKFNQKEFETQIQDWVWQWVNNKETYPAQPQGDAVTKVNELYKKYRETINAAYGLQATVDRK